MCYEKTVETAVEEVGEAEYSILFGICDGGFGVFSEHEYYPPWEPPVSRFRATRKFLP